MVKDDREKNKKRKITVNEIIISQIISNMDIAMKKKRGYLHIVSYIIAIISAIIGTFISGTTIFIAEKSLSSLLVNKYFLMIINIIISFVLIISFSLIIYKIQKIRKENKNLLYKNIKFIEKDLFLTINNDVNKFITNGIYNE